MNPDLRDFYILLSGSLMGFVLFDQEIEAPQLPEGAADALTAHKETLLNLLAEIDKGLE